MNKLKIFTVSVLSVLMFSSCSSKELATVSQNNIESEQSVEEKKEEISVDQFINNELLQEYEQVSDDAYLEWKIDIDSNEVYFDCDNFKNTLIGWIGADLDNDSKDDLLTISLEKHNKDFDVDGEDNSIFIHLTPYIYENGIYIKKPDLSYKLFGLCLSISDNITIEYRYAVMPDKAGQSLIIQSETVDDDSVVYSIKYPPYYSAENSLGNFNTQFLVRKYVDENFLQQFGYQEQIGHISGMPEAEHITYFDTQTGEELYSAGVTSVLTGSDMPSPEFKTEKSGVCDTEQEAIEEINQKLEKYNLSKYKLGLFSWKDRYNNSLILREPQNISCSFKLVGKTVSENKRYCYIEIN